MEELKKWNRWLLIGLLLMVMIFGIYTNIVDKQNQKYQFEIEALESQIETLQIESN